MYRILLTLLFALASCGAHGQAHESKVEILKGEKWWGIHAGGSLVQPLERVERTSVSGSGPAAGPQRPMLVSSSGRLIYADHPFEISFDGDTFTIRPEGESVSAERVGRTLRDAYLVACHRHFPPSGEFAATRLLTSPVYETELTQGQAQGQERLLEYASRLLEEGFPAGTIVIPDGWRSFGSGFVPDPVLYPDPKGMVAELRGMGFDVMLTVTPFIPVAGRNYVDARRNGLLLCGGDGDGICGWETPEGIRMAVYDITRKDVRDAFAEGVRSLRDTWGIDMYRFDCSGAEGALARHPKVSGFHAAWEALGEDAGAVEYAGITDTGLAGRIFSVSDSGTTTQEEMINDIICAGLLGFSYTRAQEPLAILSAGDRAMAASIFAGTGFPVFCVGFSPWLVADGRLYEGVKEAVRFRASIAEYVAELAKASERTGEPLVRHLEYQFPKTGFADCHDQFMLGHKYMFAPPVDGSPKRMVRIPKGTWTDGNGVRRRGPLVTEVDATDLRALRFELSDK